MRLSEDSKRNFGNLDSGVFRKQALPACLSEWKALRRQIRQQLSMLSFQVMGSTAPNPPVAALCVALLYEKKEVHFIGGATEPAGMRHAEIVCLDAFDKICKRKPGMYEKAPLHFYVTLEPCTKYGRTPPCVDRICQYTSRKSRIWHLHYFLSDPFLALPAKNLLREVHIRVSQLGVGVPSRQENLQLPGKESMESTLQAKQGKPEQGFWRSSVLSNATEDLGFSLQGFLKRITKKRPRLHIKIACTKDGVVGLRSGRLLISGQSALQFGMRLRAHTDAVLTGPGTIACDSPSLNLRIEEYGRKPLLKKKRQGRGEELPDAFLSHLLFASTAQASCIERHLSWYGPDRIFLLGRSWPGASDFFSKQAQISGTMGGSAFYYAPEYELLWKEYEKEIRNFKLSNFGEKNSGAQKSFWPDFLSHLAFYYNDILVEAGPGLLTALTPHLGTKDCIYILESKKTFAELFNKQGGSNFFAEDPNNKNTKCIKESAVQKKQGLSKEIKKDIVHFPKDYRQIIEQQSLTDLGEDLLYFYKIK